MNTKYLCLGIAIGVMVTCLAAALLGLVAWWLGGLERD